VLLSLSASVGYFCLSAVQEVGSWLQQSIKNCKGTVYQELQGDGAQSEGLLAHGTLPFFKNFPLADRANSGCTEGQDR